MKKHFSVQVLLVVFMFTILGYHFDLAAKETILLGTVTDLTGPASSMVVAMDAWAFKEYFDVVNKEKGGIKGHQVEYIIMETEYKMDKIKTAYESLVSKKIVGMMCSMSPALEGFRDRFVKDQIPVMMGTGNTVAMWPAGWIYTNWATYADASGFLIDYLIDSAKGKGET